MSRSKDPLFVELTGMSYGGCNGIYHREGTHAKLPVYKKINQDRWIWFWVPGLVYVIGKKKHLHGGGGYYTSKQGSHKSRGSNLLGKWPKGEVKGHNKEAKLIKLDFDSDKATVHGADRPPRTVQKQVLENSTCVEQEMSFEVAYESSKTNEWEHSIGFEYSVGTEIGCKFLFSSMSVGFTLSHSHTFKESKTESSTRTYSFPLKVAPKKVVTAKAKVTETNLDVPYTLVFSFDGGKLIKVPGVWKGVMYGSATYTIKSKDLVEYSSDSD